MIGDRWRAIVAGWLVLGAATLGGVMLGGVMFASGAARAASCRPGASCIPAPPVALTNRAGPIGAQSATLNGASGAGAAAGESTTYYFKLGTTRRYGNTTSSGLVGSCPSSTAGHVPSRADVAADIAGHEPCTTYHDRIVSIDADGTRSGDDVRFTTRFGAPLRGVSVRRRVRRASRVRSGSPWRSGRV